MKYLAILLLLSCSCLGQDFDNLKKIDTLFLVLESEKKLERIRINEMTWPNQCFVQIADIDDPFYKFMSISIPSKYYFGIPNKTIYNEKNGRILDLELLDKTGIKKLFFQILNYPNESKIYYLWLTDENSKSSWIKIDINLIWYFEE